MTDPAQPPVITPLGDVLVGSGVTLGPGESMTVQASFRAPGVETGIHFWSVTTNINGEVFEGSATNNNETLSAGPVTVGIPQIALGAVTHGRFNAAGEASWYALTPSTTQDLRIDLGLSGNGTPELYLGTSYLPTPVSVRCAQRSIQHQRDQSLHPPGAGRRHLLPARLSSLFGFDPRRFHPNHSGSQLPGEIGDPRHGWEYQ